MTRPAIPPPPPAPRDTVPTPPPDCDDLPWPDGEPASGVRSILSPETAARLHAEWEAAMAPSDPRSPWADCYALDAEASL